MRRVVYILLTAMMVAQLFTGCATTSETKPATGPSAPLGTATSKPAKTLSDEVQETVTAVDQILNRYDSILTRIQKLPEGKPAAKLFEEVGAYVGGEKLETTVAPSDAELLSGLTEGFTFATRLVMTEQGIDTDLLDLSKRLIALNARTLDLAGTYDQGKTLRTYVGKLRREVLPLLAQVRALTLADSNDATHVAQLDAETQKILTTSRQSLHALERETRNIELELGGK